MWIVWVWVVCLVLLFSSRLERLMVMNVLSMGWCLCWVLSRLRKFS